MSEEQSEKDLLLRRLPSFSLSLVVHVLLLLGLATVTWYAPEKKLKNIDTNLESKIYKLERQFLHAQTLGFIHPKTNKEMIFTSILPQELENILILLRNTKISS